MAEYDIYLFMSWHGNIFHITGSMWEEPTAHRRISLAKEQYREL